MNDDQILSLLNTSKTPLYVFEMYELEKRIKYLREHLPSTVELCYAIKANSFIVKKVSELVDWLEICSPGEYEICEALSLPRSKYVISGVNKNRDHIMSAVAKDENIGFYTVESVNQFHLLHESAKKNAKRIPVLLRLTSSNQFGLDESELLKLVEDYRNDEFIDIYGVQYFSGTQKKSLKKMQRELDYVNKVIDILQDEMNFEVRKLEFGPGLAVAYFEEEDYDEDEFLKSFSEMLNNMKYKGEIALELGRSIAASCGTYLTSVADLKCNNSEYYAIVDGGINQITYYGQSMAMKHPMIRLLPAREARNDEVCNNVKEWNICGSLCTINDFLVKRHPLADLKVGDVMAFERAGAYCVTEGIALFLTRELPGVVLLEKDGTFKTVREQIPTEIFNTPKNI